MAGKGIRVKIQVTVGFLVTLAVVSFIVGILAAIALGGVR